MTGRSAVQKILMTLNNTHTPAAITTTRSDQLAVHRRPALRTCERSTPTFGERSIASWRVVAVRSSTLGFSSDAGPGLCVMLCPFVEVVPCRALLGPPNQVHPRLTASEASADPPVRATTPG